MRFPLRYQTPANNRALMLIGDGRETNPTSEVFAYVESIEDVVGKLVCTDCQGYPCSWCDGSALDRSRDDLLVAVNLRRMFDNAVTQQGPVLHQTKHTDAPPSADGPAKC
jgi:hypothetical protein